MNRLIAVVAVTAFAGSLTVGLVSPATAGPRPGSPVAVKLDKASSHTAVKVTMKVVLKGYNPKTGKLVIKKRYPLSTEGDTLKLPKVLTKGITDSGTADTNPYKVQITQTGWSLLRKKLWHFTTWVKWYHNLQGPGLAHVINVVDKGVDGAAEDSYWEYDGLVIGSSVAEYYDACQCGVNHSGYIFDKTGQFTGPDVTRHDVHRRPENLIVASEKTWFWMKGSA